MYDMTLRPHLTYILHSFNLHISIKLTIRKLTVDCIACGTLLSDSNPSDFLFMQKASKMYTATYTHKICFQHISCYIYKHISICLLSKNQINLFIFQLRIGTSNNYPKHVCMLEIYCNLLFGYNPQQRRNQIMSTSLT